ncbi:threonine synthase [Desmospora profundinema]|uniref:Threonine synthase n=1 Tax=Desmospora profundinema TaxID=1571184 RepID=A0ABU1IHW9_9BACL|nr:threonine synthase [Desmospora profundinema]MDR6224370.1 threonine synthase [Desmospora profundinema]
MSFSYASSLYCPKCTASHPLNKPINRCTCGSPLLVQYSLKELKSRLNREDLKERPPTLWRYHELLPLQKEENIISLGEGMTPLLEMKKTQHELGISRLFMKDEGLAPTGSFKARGAAVGISRAKELGIKEIAMPTNGNAGASWSLYAAKASIKSHIVMPAGSPPITRREVTIAGSDLHLVDGLISDAGKIIARLAEKYGWFDVSTLKEPYRIEGKKTMGFEIAEQMKWSLPDVIVYPTGGGVGLIGIYKAFRELIELGWINKEDMPRLVAVQAEECAPIVKAFEEKKRVSTFWPDSKTAAFGINVPKAIGDFLVLEAIYRTNGMAISVSDERLLAEQRRIARQEGIFVCPEGAAAFAAVRELRNQGWIRPDHTVVCLNTGMGIKYSEIIEVEATLLQPDDT